MTQPETGRDRTGANHFGMTHSSYVVLPGVLVRSMPEAWQQQMSGLLDDLLDAFGPVLPVDPPRYIVQPATERRYADLTDDERRGASFNGDDVDTVLVPKTDADLLANYQGRVPTPIVPDGGWRHLPNQTGEIARMAGTLNEIARHLARITVGIDEYIDRRADELTEERMRLTRAQHAEDLAVAEQQVRLAEQRAAARRDGTTR